MAKLLSQQVAIFNLSALALSSKQSSTVGLNQSCSQYDWKPLDGRGHKKH